MEILVWLHLVVFFTCYVTLSFVVGVQAERNGRSALAYCFVSLFFTPLVGGAVLLLLGSTSRKKR